MSGYSETYVNDFNGSALPAGMYAFIGTPGGDPGSVWATSHVTVSGGLLQLNTYQDSNYGNSWVSGGIGQLGSQTYGAYFVRSRITGPGPTVVQLLWPANNSWPPEIDFNESYGRTTDTSANVHYTSANLAVQRTLTIDMTQWHTFGVIWTPTSITYTVDGQVWATDTVAASIPNVPMVLSIDSQTWCTPGLVISTCPTAPVSQLVDWVAEYSPN
jgi:beta-glucanase (GH16 family)